MFPQFATMPDLANGTAGDDTLRPAEVDRMLPADLLKGSGVRPTCSPLELLCGLMLDETLAEGWSG